MVALVQVSTVLPIMLFSLPAGAAADVWDRRVIMLLAQVSMLAVSTALAVLAWFGQITPWLSSFSPSCLAWGLPFTALPGSPPSVSRCPGPSCRPLSRSTVLPST
jgi:MFS family permease